MLYLGTINLFVPRGSSPNTPMNNDEIKLADVNGVQLAYLERGQGPLVICQHGFPDSAYSFLPLLETLAAAGYHAVAPFLRGYYPSALASDKDYSMPTVAHDLLALIDLLGDGKGYLIGHDWGGIAAYTAANIAPDKIIKLMVMSVPHMAATTMTWAQLKKSWYVLFFQLPWLPEYMVARNNFAFIEWLYKSWCPYWPTQEFALAPVKQALGIAGGTKAALSYYRALIRGSNAAQRALMERITSVPSLWLTGSADGSVGLDQFATIEKAFSASFELVVVDGAGHFVHREAPQLVEQKIITFLAG